MFKTVWDGMKFYTRGITGFVDVKDVVKAMILLMDEENFRNAKNQRYIISAEDWSYQDVFYKIAESLGKPKPTVFASDFLLQLIWRLFLIAKVLTGKTSLITKESVANSNKIFSYDGSKIVKMFGFKYLLISDSIQQNAALLKQDMQSVQ
jgi:nucleoside-diphosphate-sugar epimerase